MNLILIHGFRASPSSVIWHKNFEDWLINNFQIKVFRPKMPDSDSPTYSDWLGAFNKLIMDENINTEETILVGHSLGGYFIHKMTEIYKFKTLIGVAPGFAFKNDKVEYFSREGNSSRDENSKEKVFKFYLEGGEFNPIKMKSGEHYCLFDENDPFIPTIVEKHYEKIFSELKIIKTKGYGHFTNYMKVEKIPELEAIISSVLQY